MDEIVNTSDNTTAMEKARNRLAAALFVFCLAVIFITALAKGSSAEFDANEKYLSEQVQYWQGVLERSNQLRADQREEFFLSALTDLIHAVCIPEKEGSFDSRRGSHGINEWPCADGYVHPTGMDFSFIAAASALAALPAPSAGKPEVRSVRNALDKALSPRYSRLLSEHYRDKEFDNIIRDWWSWPVQRLWIAEGKFYYQPDKIKNNYLYLAPNPLGPPLSERHGGGVSGFPGEPIKSWPYSTLNDSRSGIHWKITPPPRYGINSSFQKDSFFADQVERNQLAAALTLPEAHQIIVTAFSNAKQRFDAHTVDRYVSQLKYEGITIGLKPALPIALMVIGLLAVLNVVYMGKAYRPSHTGEKLLPASSDDWFPRLGSPSDPFVGPKPQGDQWIARLFWLAFLAMPLFFSFSLVWTRLDLRGFLYTASDYWNGVPTTWFDASLFMLVWWCSLRFTAPRSVSASQTTNWFAWITTLVSAAYFLGGGLVYGALGMEIRENGYMLGRDDVGGWQSWSWEWVTLPSYWLIPGIWMLIALQRRNVSRFAFFAAALMTVAVLAGFGRMIALYWLGAFGPPELMSKVYFWIFL